MLEARSVAVVGASVKEGSLGQQMLLELARGGYDGAIYPVNPGYDEVLGHRCYPSLADLPEPVDLAIVGVANQRIEQAVRDAGESGAGSVVTFSSLFEEEPSEAGMPPLGERVAAIAREHDMALFGGNGMGFVNLGTHLYATGFLTPDDLEPGAVTFLSHSGSVFSALLFNDRQIRFNLIVSSGQEIVTTMDEYLSYALDLDSTTDRCPAARNGPAARRVRRRAREGGRARRPGLRPEGRSDGGIEADGRCPFGRAGGRARRLRGGLRRVRRARVPGPRGDGRRDRAVLQPPPRDAVAPGSRRSTTPGVSAPCSSTSRRISGIPLAKISDETRERIDAVLDPGLVAENPLDAWGTGIDADRIYRESFQALHDDPDTAVVAFVVDLTRQGQPYDEGYLQVARDVWEATTKPFCVISNLPATIAKDEVGMLRGAGIPVLEGTVTGLRALTHLLDDASARERPTAVSPPGSPAGIEGEWRRRFAEATDLSESAALGLLYAYDITVVDTLPARSPDEAERAAERIGYPVAVKTAVPGISHKSDVGGVRLGVVDPLELREAYRDLAERLGPDVTIAAMAPPGVEVALGVVRDPTFGPLVVVAAGGVLVELIHDRKLALPPIDEDAARRLIDGLAMRPLLDGVRGAPPSDVDALARAVSRLSVLAVELGDVIAELDVNPVIVSPSGCVAVDALVIPARDAER